MHTPPPVAGIETDSHNAEIKDFVQTEAWDTYGCVVIPFKLQAFISRLFNIFSWQCY